jgi:hypothetical protein
MAATNPTMSVNEMRQQPQPVNNQMNAIKLLGLFLALATAVQAQLAVTVLPVKTTGNKAVIPLAMKNNFTNRIESARAVCFLLDDQGKMVGQSTKWVIGGTKDRPALAAGATNTFNFVITSPQSFTTTNLTAKVSFSRVVLDGGRQADLTKQVTVTNPK